MSVEQEENCAEETCDYDEIKSDNEFVHYTAPKYHWFYETENWTPFTVKDSDAIETAYVNSNNESSVTVSTNGDRYDVDVVKKTRKAVYWDENESMVRRCLWFYRSESSSIFTPYSEEFAEKLELEYKKAAVENKWHRKVFFEDKSKFYIFSGPNVAVEYTLESNADQWNDANESHFKVKQVRRGVEEFDVESGEPNEVDHLVFLVHGVGSICDWRFRGLTEVVDDFRTMTAHMMQNHFKNKAKNKRRVECLPVSWHMALHGDNTGIDERLKLITLQSIPKLRNFSNDTVLDALFYTSPVYCQTIIDAVASELNRLYNIFKKRNPHFKGNVAVVGHSLGSLILFDILSHQRENEQQNVCSHVSHENINDIRSLCAALNLSEYLDTFVINNVDLKTLSKFTKSEFESLSISEKAQLSIRMFFESQKSGAAKEVPMECLSRQSSVASVTYNFGSPGTGHPFIKYPQLEFNPHCFFALGSPIAMFLTVRGIETLKPEFKLPTCPRVFNIFHPFDPIAYRIEPMIDPSFSNVKPVLIPHHKGRKRMHLELKENIFKVGSDIKQKVVESLKSTWNSISDFARAHQPSTQLVPEIEAQTVDSSEEKMNTTEESSIQNSDSGDFSQRRISSEVTDEEVEELLICGQLNGGKRIDYVLQETPIEFFNEYIFALATHACYWESEDTALLLLKELYSS
ncbi:phospholipase DDHD2-like protein [Leptotrombidium deliense]|uniref:Phospholipase DDHD2-like protein n=1 Tax=Leptotrombidium deliense TaxID=299467 RepID=A0A443SGZ5_9ACAR|nr:phospholipase DDHD2-like protein [Leptotrombidium deliense]